jgi:hypothetical protein
MALRSIKLICASVIFLNLCSVSVLACSYADGSLPSTEYDLIKEADAILLAQPISKSGDGVDFKVIEILKGEFQGSEFHGSERHTSCEDYAYSLELEHNIPYPLLAQKLPKINPKYVLFLSRTEDGWTISSSAADRMNEAIIDVNSSAFLKTVKHFIRVSSANSYEVEKRELKKLRQLARSGQNPKEYPNTLIDLIDRHLSSPTPSKSYQDLVRLYTKFPEEKKRQVLWAFAWGKHPEAADFFTTLLKSPIPSNYIGPISKYITQTKNETLLVKLGKNYPELDKQTRWPLMWALIKTADIQHQDLMLAALRSADKEEAGRLAEWFVRHPVAEAIEIVRGLVGIDYKKYRELTFNLAGMGDIGALDWAREFMKSPDEDRWIAFYTIAHSQLEEADVPAESVIEGTDAKGLVWLIQGYRNSHNPNRLDRLRDVANLKTRDSEVDYWLRRTLESMANDGDSNAEELLKTLQR